MLYLAFFACLTFAAVAGVLLATRRAAYWPGALALSGLLALNLAQLGTSTVLVRWQEAPYVGTARLVVYADGAVILGALAVPLALALAVFAHERRRMLLLGVVLAWLAGSVALALPYPSDVVRGAGLQRIYLGADLAALFAAVASVGWWARLRKPPSGAQALSLALTAADVTVLLTPYSPWRSSLFGADYSGVQLQMVVLYSVIGIVEVLCLAFAPSPPSSRP